MVGIKVVGESEQCVSREEEKRVEGEAGTERR